MTRGTRATVARFGRMTVARIGLGAMLALWTGAAGQAATHKMPPPPEGMDPALEADCAAQGGRIVIGIGGPVCGLPEPDAGAACTSSDECSGFCLAETRSCSPIRPFFGCHALYEEGKGDVTICID